MKRLFTLLLLAASAHAAITSNWAGTDRGSNASGSSVTSISTSATNHSAGKALVALVRIGQSGVTATVTNTAGDTWSACSPAGDNGGGAGTIQWFYTLSTVGNANDVVTASFSSAPYVAILVGELTGVATSSAQDICSRGDFSSTASITTSSFTTDTADEILLQGAVWGALGYTVTAGSGYTAIVDSNGMCGLQYQSVSAIQTGATATMTTSSSNNGSWTFLTLRGAATSSSPRRAVIF